MDIRKVLIIIIIIVCAFALAYGIYYQAFQNGKDKINENQVENDNQTSQIEDFDKIFDNSMDMQEYTVNDKVKVDQTKELVYTNYNLTEIYEGKYDIKARIPVININGEKIANINKEISSIFQEKLNSIVANKNNANAMQTVYTVEYTACLNENILSIVIKSTLKEGNNAQRLIIKAYTYNLSTNEIISLSNMLEIKGKEKQTVEQEIRKVVRESITNTDKLAALGYTVYERDINSSIYQVANANNYFLGPNGTIYIIYAYGNSSFTTEKDIVVIK